MWLKFQGKIYPLIVLMCGQEKKALLKFIQKTIFIKQSKRVKRKKLKVKVVYSGPIEAPIKKDQKLAKLKIIYEYCKKLKDDGTIFTGAFWSGQQALELGLIDGIGEIRSVLRDRFGSNVKIKYITKNYLIRYMIYAE